MTERAGRSSPPAQVAKIASAGVSGVFVFGLAAVMGWAARPGGEQVVVPVQPAATVPATVGATTSLVPLATTVPAAPAPAAVPAPVNAPAAVTVAATPVTPLPAPVIVVSEQSQ